MGSPMWTSSRSANKLIPKPLPVHPGGLSWARAAGVATSTETIPARNVSLAKSLVGLLKGDNFVSERDDA